ncbi:Ribonuclease H protein [Senna tora]|uniref:Ribonuclease H protein n=1 Tax=Senna tora TaxID=362788 RepID=A0A834XFI0_9FABA|nr:Ribonuclease H protein [Senna tora]
MTPTITAIFGLCEIWLGRNALIFENKLFNPRFVGKKAVFKAIEFYHLNVNNAPVRSVVTSSVGWEALPLGWWKLNTDGSCQGEGNSLMAELWAIIEGLKLAKLLQCNNLIVESDSLAAMKLINSNDCGNLHQFSTLIRICRAILLDFSEVKVVHIYREGHACADTLAKQALVSKSPLMYFVNLPPCISSPFEADLFGIKFSRSRKSDVLE